MSRSAAFLIPVLMVATAAASIVAWHEHQQLDAQAPILEKAALLQSEEDGLRGALAGAERKATDAQNILRRSQIERDAAEIRELNFKEPVVYESLDRAGIRQVVAGKMSEEYSDQEMQDMSTGYSALGLLPANYPLKQEYIDLLGEQIAAFYDQHQHKLFMFQDASLENAQNRVILAHELTHALQDQNFGLLKLALELKDNDDRAEAASALIEGDATLVMSQYMARDMTWRTLSDSVGYSVTQSMEQMRKAPRFLREMLVFPYLKGQQFCAAAYERGGYPALSAVYADPPSSTAQILHPEKYFPETRENPIPVAYPKTTFAGEKPLADNVLGEMGCRILFAQGADADAADQAAAGWRGDRYLVFDHGDELVWKSVWRSGEAADAAVSAFERVCDRRFQGTASVPGELNSQAMSWGASPSAHFLRMVRTGANEVVFVLATDQKSSDSLQQQFAGAPHG